MSKNTRNRILLTAVAALLLVAVTVGGTLAYLTANSGPVTNTFVPTTITVNIDEHKYNKADNTLGTDLVKTNTDYLMVPGRDIMKDPMVDASSDVAFYVFVTIKEEDWLSALTYGIASGWTMLENGVYYQLVNTANADGKYSITDVHVLDGDKVNVNASLTQTEMTGHAPMLIFNAYAIQQEGTASPEDAWSKVKPATT